MSLVDTDIFGPTSPLRASPANEPREPRRLRVLSVSSARAYRACPRLYFYQYEACVRPASQNENARFGTLAHCGLEAWWHALIVGTDPLAEAHAAIAAREADDFERAKASELLRGYHYRWLDDDGPTAVRRVLSVEREFSAALVNPSTGRASPMWMRAGKMDVVVELADGRECVVEHKTSSEDIEPGSDYWRRLALDSQVSGYYAGGKALGHDIRGCLYDVLARPALRPSSVPVLDERGTKIVRNANGDRIRTKDGKKWRETPDSKLGYTLETRPETADEYAARIRNHIADNPERYFARGLIVRLEEDEHEAARDVWLTAKQIRESRNDGAWPRNDSACVRYGSTCAFLDVCCRTASLDDPTRFRRVEWPHEELSSDIVQAPASEPDGSAAAQ